MGLKLDRERLENVLEVRGITHAFVTEQKFRQLSEAVTEAERVFDDLQAKLRELRRAGAVILQGCDENVYSYLEFNREDVEEFRVALAAATL